MEGICPAIMVKRTARPQQKAAPFNPSEELFVALKITLSTKLKTRFLKLIFGYTHRIQTTSNMRPQGLMRPPSNKIFIGKRLSDAEHSLKNSKENLSQPGLK
ncbi:MAG: hypothetical protein R2769_09055 [Saprospiraceae bacterium]